jgi:hypothetical protein
MATLNDIDKLTKAYSDTREDLGARVANLEEELEAIRKKYMPGIKRCINTAADQSSRIRAAVEESRELFGRPKTIVLHGIKVGFQKGKGKLEWEDDEIVVRLIERHFPDQAEVLIKTVKKPRKDGLNSLTVQELKRIRVTAEETGEMIVVRPVDTDVDKIVKALLKEQDECAEEAA